MRSGWLGILSGLVFVAALGVALSGIDPDWYTARDDGVITLSAARNLVDFGFIGVNPSGPIVEASSAPLEFMVYSIVYWLSGIDYLRYSTLQGYVSYFLIGFVFSLFFRARPLVALGLSVFAACALAFFPSFIEWQCSGMENAITHLMLLLATFLLYETFTRGRVNHLYAIPLFLASISRIEGIYLVGPLLLAFAVAWRVRHGNHDVVTLFLATAALWVVFMALRHAYFGEWLPQTAHAQRISVTYHLERLLVWDLDALGRSAALSGIIFWRLGLWLIVPGALLFLLSWKTPAHGFLSSACLTLILLALANPFVFGPSRIDLVRTTSFAPLFMVLAISSCLHSVRSPWRSLGAAALLLLSAAPLLHGSLRPYYLGWSTGQFEEVRRTFMAMARANDIARPTVANFDLGALTWHKELNDVDLGMLGSPVVSWLRKGRPLTVYLVDYAAPDFIELHAEWVARSCDSLLRDAAFNEKYVQYDSDYDIDMVCEMLPAEMPRIFWQRKEILKDSASAERVLLDDLQDALGVERIAAELARCQELHPGERRACSYVARTVYRFLPELRRSSRFEDVYRLFSDPPDQALLIGWRDPRAHEVIIESVQRDASAAETTRIPQR